MDNVLSTGMDTRGVEIRQATVDDLHLLVPLFDAYRQFYRQPSEPERARGFLLDRFGNNQSVVFLAFADAAAIGFTQLYPSFSSGAMARIFILNDLVCESRSASSWSRTRAAPGGRGLRTARWCAAASAFDGSHQHGGSISVRNRRMEARPGFLLVPIDTLKPASSNRETSH